MTRDEKIAEARRMRDEGATLVVIAEALGYRSVSAAWRLLNPEAHRAIEAKRGPAKRAWENEHDHGRCPCGAQMGVGTARRGAKLCCACRDEVRSVERAMREERIAAMWADGLTLRQIAVALGSTPAAINVAIVQMRANGWDVPRRHNWTPEGLERVRAARRAA